MMLIPSRMGRDAGRLGRGARNPSLSSSCSYLHFSTTPGPESLNRGPSFFNASSFAINLGLTSAITGTLPNSLFSWSRSFAARPGLGEPSLPSTKRSIRVNAFKNPNSIEAASHALPSPNATFPHTLTLSTLSSPANK